MCWDTLSSNVQDRNMGIKGKPLLNLSAPLGEGLLAPRNHAHYPRWTSPCQQFGPFGSTSALCADGWAPGPDGWWW